MFASKTALDKYRCIHCNKIPKVFHRCECGRVDKSEVGKGKSRYENNTGLSCGDCRHLPCTKCNRSDRYKLDRTTNTNVLKLKVHCQQDCGEKLILSELNNHTKNKCSKKRRPCKYNWAGCQVEDAGQGIEDHENDKLAHFDMVVSTLQMRIESLEEANTNSQQVLRSQSLPNEASTQPPSTSGPSRQ